MTWYGEQHGHPDSVWRELIWLLSMIVPTEVVNRLLHSLPFINVSLPVL